LGFFRDGLISNQQSAIANRQSNASRSMHCRIGEHEPDNEDDSPKNRWSKVQEIGVAHHWMNPDRSCKPDYSREAEHLPETLRRPRTPNTKEHGNAGSADCAAKARSVMGDEWYEPATD
jgi:hypothetical protein